MLRGEKRTIILTTQFFDEAELLADRLMVLSAGKTSRSMDTLKYIGKLIANGQY